ATGRPARRRRRRRPCEPPMVRASRSAPADFRRAAGVAPAGVPDGLRCRSDAARTAGPRCNPRATSGRVDLAAPARGQAGPGRPGKPTGAQNMFFLTYLRRELRRRMRQAVFIALGLALGIGLVVTVTAASADVKKAQADVLKSLYGVGTDATVTGPAPKQHSPSSGPSKEGQTFKLGPGGAQICQNGKCHSAAGQTIDNLTASNYGPISQSKVAAVAALKHVKTAAGGLALTDMGVKIPKNFGGPSSQPPTPNSFNVNGVDTSHLSLGPLSAGTVTSGRSLTGADAHSNV